MLAHGHGDALVTGATRKSAHVLGLINHVFDARAEDGAVAVTAVLLKGRIVLIADTLVHEWPDEKDLAHIAMKGADVARMLGLEPRVAFVSFSTFGYPRSERAEKMHAAPRVLDEMGVDFEYEGDVTVDVALEHERDGGLSVLAAHGAGECAGRAGAALSLDLGETVAGNGRGHGRRAHSYRGRPTDPDLFDRLDGERHSEHGRSRGECAGLSPNCIRRDTVPRTVGIAANAEHRVSGRSAGAVPLKAL